MIDKALTPPRRSRKPGLAESWCRVLPIWACRQDAGATKLEFDLRLPLSSSQARPAYASETGVHLFYRTSKERSLAPACRSGPGSWSAPRFIASVKSASRQSAGHDAIDADQQDTDSSWRPTSTFNRLCRSLTRDSIWEIRAEHLSAGATGWASRLGNSSYVRPSSLLPPSDFRTPPHCLKKNAISAFWH